MTAKVKVGIVLFVLTAVAAGASAHTEEEFVAKGREMIGTSMSTYFDNEDDLLAAAESDDPLYHWDNKTQDGFFNFFVTNDWPRADCEMAFDKRTGDIAVVCAQSNGHRSLSCHRPVCPHGRR